MTAKSHSNNMNAKTAFFAGSFDPFTIGHASVVERALSMFDRIIIGVGINPAKSSAEDGLKKAEAIKCLYNENPSIKVVTYTGLTVDAALAEKADCLLRGVRSVKDFEYERDMADINRQLSGIETVLIYSMPEHAAISSSIVRELQAFGKDVSEYLPK